MKQRRSALGAKVDHACATRVACLPRGAVVLLVLVALAGCVWRSSAPPEPGYSRGGVPELRGERVLVLPVQIQRGGHADAQQELLYALQARGDATDWVGPSQLAESVQASRELGVNLDRLPVEGFLMGDLERVGDPLFGFLYRLGAFENAAYALIPVQLGERPVAPMSDASEEALDDRVTVELHTALIRVRTGHVLWYGVTEGSAGAPGNLSSAASTAEALARRIIR